MPVPTVILAQLEVEGCTAELSLNGVPVVRIEPRNLPIANAAVEELIIPGENRLEVLVEPGSHPTVARSEQRSLPFRPMKATGRLIRFQDGDPGLKEEGEILVETTWSWTSAPPDARVFPQSSLAAVALGGAHGRWGFQDAPVLSQSAELFAEAEAVIEALETALRRGDAGAMWSLVQLKAKDVARAYPAYDEASLRAELDRMMAFVALAPDPVAPRDPKNHDFRLVAGGRMLELVDRDYRPSLNLLHHERGTRQPYPLRLARIDGILRVVR